ncbi:MAG: amidophosphoribosyltransferase [Oscillospiraceae bacterium]
MGGFFGVTSRRDCVMDVFFGTDYHSHLGTRRGGMAAWSQKDGIQREIHNIENTPFRTKFENDVTELKGPACIGCISDTEPQPLLVRSRLGVCAISMIGIINNAEELAQQFMNETHGHFEAMGGGRISQVELLAALINRKGSFEEGIRYAQEQIVGTASILILTDKGEIIAARDKEGRLPIIIGEDDDGFCVSFESFAFEKLGYRYRRDIGPGEIVKLNPEGYETLSPAGDRMKICTFLWTYYGYPNSCYEGTNVEISRNANGRIMAQNDRMAGGIPDVDYVCGVPDSGIAHAIGYSNESHIPYARPFIKYTPTWPRSFMPHKQEIRNQVAKMKLIPVHQLIDGKKLLFVDDSIVRGTQLRGTVNFLFENGAKELHMRSACPPIMFGCKYLNFSRSTSDMELIARRTIKELEGDAGQEHADEYVDGSTDRGKAMRSHICKKLGFDSLEYQTLDGTLDAIGIDRCKLCTYCWNGAE